MHTVEGWMKWLQTDVNHGSGPNKLWLFFVETVKNGMRDADKENNQENIRGERGEIDAEWLREREILLLFFLSCAP